MEGESDKSTPVNQNAANQITTKADVEVNHQVSDGEVEQGEILALKLREDTDSDLSPDAGYRIRKRRKAVRRTKSSLEPSTRPTLPLHDVGMKSSVRSSLPPHQRFSMQTVLEQGQSESGLIRPHSDQNIVKRVRRSRRPGEGCAVVDVEQNIAVRRPSPCSLTVESEEACILHRMDRSNILCHRSASVDETVIPSRSKARPKPSMESATSLEAEIMLKLIARKQLEESERTCDVDVCKNLEESEWTSGCEKTQDTEETSCDIDIVQTPSGDSDKPCDIVKVKEIFDDETKSDKSKHKSKVPSSPHLSRSTEVLSDGTCAKSDSKPPTNSASVDGLGDKKLERSFTAGKPRRHRRSKDRPCSVGDLDTVPANFANVSEVGSGVNSKPKDLSLTSRIARFLQGGNSDNAPSQQQEAAPSQQSSTVGLDWLFSTDSDSLSSDGRTYGTGRGEYSATHIFTLIDNWFTHGGMFSMCK